jgi:hypothetical protein
LGGGIERDADAASDVRPELLGLLLGSRHDHLGVAPGLLYKLLAGPVRFLEDRGDLDAKLVEGRRRRLQVADLALEQGGCSLGGLHAGDELRQGCVDLRGIMASPDHREGR